MRPFETVSGVAAPLLRADIDTDQIIDRDFTITVSRKGLGRGFLWHWRHRPDGPEDPAFVLNQEPYRRARILITGANFACGSSREHAVWSMQDWGIGATIASSYGSHFYENAFKNGLLPVTLPEDQVQSLARFVLGRAGHASTTVCLDAMQVSVTDGPCYPFSLPDDRREALLIGLDEIDATLRHAGAIDRFQADDAARRPWMRTGR